MSSSRYEQLKMIDKKRMTAMCHRQLYQCRVDQAFNKKVKPKVFKEDDLVLKKHNQARHDRKGKFTPTYEVPYVVKNVFSRGTVILANTDGHDFNLPTNSNAAIPYFA